MSRLLVAYPGVREKPLVWDRPDVVVFDESGWWIADGQGSRRCVDTFSFPIDWSAAAANPTALIETLKGWSPLWTRWVAYADQYELHYREAALYVLHVQSALAALGIGEALLNTGISHHLETSLVEIACAGLGIEQVFMYTIPLTGGRLLPLAQRRSIADRHAFAAKVSDYDAREDLVAFQENSAAGKPPRLGFFDAPINRSYAFGVLNAYHLGVRRRLARIKGRLQRTPTPNSVFFEQFAPFTSAEFLRMLRQQRKAIEYLAARTPPDTLADVVARQKSPVIVLAAHFQPEGTSFPEGGELGNHIDIVMTLRSRGYDGPILYKEHVSSAHYYAPFVHQTRVGMTRSVSYYKRLEELGCIFVNPRGPIPIDPALNERFVPVTITGTIALERASVGLETIVAGHPWYGALPGTTHLPAMAFADGAWARPACREELGRRAFAYLHDVLSRHTIINVPGTGTGVRLHDRASVDTFNSEFSRLVDALVQPD